MTDLNKQELRRLAEAAAPFDWEFDWLEKAVSQLRKACTPAAILSLLDEMECQERQLKDWQASHHANYCSVAEERDQLRAEVEELRKEAERYRDALAHVAAQVDGNIREAVRDCVNFIGDVQDIYGYCDQIDEIIDTAIDPDLAKEGNANG